MGCSRASAMAMYIAVVLLVLVALADGRRYEGRGGKGGGGHHRFGMGDCGRNRTCRELSRECKKMLFTSMLDDYVDAGDDEIITTVEKMAAMMEMLMEHQKNLTDCANETGIELPNSGGSLSSMAKPSEMSRNGGERHHGGGGRRLRGWRGAMAVSRGTRELNYRAGREAPNTRLYSGLGRKGHGGRGGGKWHNGNFGVGEEDARELKNCLLNKKELLHSNDTLDRSAFKAQITSAYDSQPDVQTAVEEAVDTCPEPEDYNIHGFIKCINKACIDNIELDDDGEDSPKGNTRNIRVLPVIQYSRILKNTD